MTRREAGRRLDALVADHLPGALGLELSRAAVRRLIVGGAVRAGRAVQRRPSWTVDTDMVVTARVDLERLTPRAEPAAVRLADGDILYEDADVIAVAKPAGVSTHASADPRRPDLVSLVRAWLHGHGANADAYVGVHQRLDRETSGVVLFTKTARANGPLAAAFAGHTLVKTYHALAVPPRRPRPETWTIDVPLAASGTGGRSRMIEAAGGLPSETEVRVVERGVHAWLIEARPRTGRRHQIRAHLAHDGMPILGDLRYGAPDTGPSRAPRVMLHCARLELQHPVAGTPLAIACAWPHDFRVTLERTCAS